jgi:FecR protein
LISFSCNLPFLKEKKQGTAMKALLRLLAATALLVVVSGPAVPISTPVGQVSKATQTVRASGNAGSRVLSKNSDIYFLDRISTNATGVGEFELAGPSASLVVDAYILKNNSSFKKLGLSAAKGTFRWISGRSSSSAYQIRTPYGTMGIRGTAFDVTVRNGRVYVALINGSAKFCNGSSCQTLNRTCDYIVADGRKLSKPEPISSAFTKRAAAAEIFPYLANPNRLSSRFRIGGRNCLGRIAAIGNGNLREAVAADTNAEPGAEPGSEPSTGHCGGGNCGNGNGNGGGNGNGDEGGGND